MKYLIPSLLLYASGCELAEYSEHLCDVTAGEVSFDALGVPEGTWTGVNDNGVELEVYFGESGRLRSINTTFFACEHHSNFPLVPGDYNQEKMTGRNAFVNTQTLESAETTESQITLIFRKDRSFATWTRYQLRREDEDTISIFASTRQAGEEFGEESGEEYTLLLPIPSP